MDNRGEKLKKKVWYNLCLVALMLLSVRAARPQGRVQVAFELSERSVTAYEPVYVRFSIQNGLKEGIRFYFDRDGYIVLSVTETDGAKVLASPVGRGGLVHVGTMSIPPNNSGTRSALLNELYQFKKPGDYRLKIKLRGSIRTESGKLIESLSQDSHELRLSVALRDPKRLAEVCETLVKAATGSSNYAQLREAAVALSYVEDPVALPYLGQLLAENNTVSEFAVPGLVRIGSSEALQVLTSHLNTPDSLLRMKIEGGIQEIKTSVHPQIMD